MRAKTPDARAKHAAYMRAYYGKHHDRQRFHFTPENFWERVHKTPTCWLWTKGTRRGYGQLMIQKRTVMAHRTAWELTHGVIPDGMALCHHCDVPLCCNPAHLFVGTRGDNNRDRDRKGRVAKGEQKPRQAKLTDAKVREIRARAALVSRRQLARVYGVSASVIGEVINGTAWKHVRQDA
jgi:hypothetical protein